MELESFELRRLPKIELHRHLDCSVRWSTFVELLKKHNVILPKDNEEAIRKFIVVDQMKDLATVLQKFLSLQQIFSSEEILTRIAFEAVEDAYNDGIVQVEFRYAPTFINEKFPNLSFEKIHFAFLKGIQEATNKFPVRAGLIVIIQRIKPAAVNEAVTDFIIAQKDTIIGVDIADNEAAALPGVFKSNFQRIRSRTSLNFTVHAGETLFEHTERSIIEAIDDLGAQRIGHGIQIYRYPQLVKKAIDQNVHLEICPISNYLTQSFPDWQSHSLPKIKNAGISFSINSDDPGMFGTTLTDDFEVCQKYYGFSEKDFRDVFARAQAASFLKGV